MTTSSIKNRKIYRPSLVWKICDELGEGAADELIRKFGGTRLMIPLNPTGSKIEEELGTSVAQILCRDYGRSVISVPKKMNMRPNAERRDYVEAHPEMTVNELARRLDVTSRTIESIRKSLREGN